MLRGIAHAGGYYMYWRPIAAGIKNLFRRTKAERGVKVFCHRCRSCGHLEFTAPGVEVCLDCKYELPTPEGPCPECGGTTRMMREAPQ
jgi:hypothetical protein